MNDNLTQNSQNLMNALEYGLASHRNAWRLEQHETYGDIKSLRNQLDECQNLYVTNFIALIILAFAALISLIGIELFMDKANELQRWLKLIPIFAVPVLLWHSQKQTYRIEKRAKELLIACDKYDCLPENAFYYSGLIKWMRKKGQLKS